jgi:hypothetical protein
MIFRLHQFRRRLPVTIPVTPALPGGVTASRYMAPKPWRSIQSTRINQIAIMFDMAESPPSQGGADQIIAPLRIPCPLRGKPKLSQFQPAFPQSYPQNRLQIYFTGQRCHFDDQGGYRKEKKLSQNSRLLHHAPHLACSMIFQRS